MVSKREKASEYFEAGYNCSQAILAAFSDELDLTEDEALRIASGFGGGMGSGETCGAVTGAIMVLGLKHGHITNEIHIDSITSDFKGKFKMKNKSINCKDLLSYDISKNDDLEKIMEKELFMNICPKLINDAVDIIESMKNNS